MTKLSKSDFMKKAINDYYKNRFKENEIEIYLKAKMSDCTAKHAKHLQRQPNYRNK